MSGESVSGALVVEKHSGISVLTNEKGYYIMDLPQGEASLEVRYLGYKPSAVTITIQKNTMLDLPMTSDNLLDTIVIGDPKSGLQLIDGGHMVDVFKTREYKSIIGETDIINNTRILPGVQSGGEGQSGLYVRGGTPDQNLILLEGWPCTKPAI
ncbi:MAG: carboxypeptidase-like regulatory domain-containing protein [Saprospiraceae bacterium]|nr:carboxypeptidase-like regulatory domain-containing protein [Saprospiraceae bacterium]